MVTDFNLIFALKGDLEDYLDKHGDTDFTKDTELYDDIFNQISATDEDYSEIHEDTSTVATSVDSASVVKNGHVEKNQNRQHHQRCRAEAQVNNLVIANNTSSRTRSIIHSSYLKPTRLMRHIPMIMQSIDTFHRHILLPIPLRKLQIMYQLLNKVQKWHHQLLSEH